MEIVGLLAAAGEDAEDRRRRARAPPPAIPAPAPPPPSASTKPSRSLENGFDAFSGGSLWVDSAESSEKRITASSVAEPSAPIEMARSHSPRRIASTPSWIAVAPDAQAVDSVIGRPRAPNRVGEPAGNRAELHGVERLLRVEAARHREQPLIAFGLAGRTHRA